MTLHNAVIKRDGKKTAITLDGFELLGVTECELKSSAGKHTELTVKLMVDGLELGLNKGCDNFGGNAFDNIKG